MRSGDPRLSRLAGQVAQHGEYAAVLVAGLGQLEGFVDPGRVPPRATPAPAGWDERRPGLREGAPPARGTSSVGQRIRAPHRSCWDHELHRLTTLPRSGCSDPAVSDVLPFEVHLGPTCVTTHPGPRTTYRRLRAAAGRALRSGQPRASTAGAMPTSAPCPPSGHAADLTGVRRRRLLVSRAGSGRRCLPASRRASEARGSELGHGLGHERRRTRLRSRG